MVKKIIKSKMEKQQQTQIIPSDRCLRSHKKHRKHTQITKNNELQDLAKKIQVMDLSDVSETKIQDIEENFQKKKSITKSKSIKKNQQEVKTSKNKKESPTQKQKTIEKNLKISPNKKQQLITKDWLNRIQQIWGVTKGESSVKKKTDQNQVIKKTQKITYLAGITVGMLKRLKPKHWLNDQIINSYIQLMEIDMIEKYQQNQQKDTKNIANIQSVHLIQSYFATLKATPQKIQRQIKKRALTISSTIIIPINDSFHWFFLVIHNGKIFISDSLLPRNLSKKQNLEQFKQGIVTKQTIKKCFQLYEILNQVKQVSLDNVYVITDFPQQNNSNDCGMMMLCGMKSVLHNFLLMKKSKKLEMFPNNLMGKQFWNFSQDDIKLLRFIFCQQLIQQSLLPY